MRYCSLSDLERTRRPLHHGTIIGYRMGTEMGVDDGLCRSFTDTGGKARLSRQCGLAEQRGGRVRSGSWVSDGSFAAPGWMEAASLFVPIATRPPTPASTG